MASKDVKFHDSARTKHRRGRQYSRRCGQGDPRPQRPQRRSRAFLRRADHHQRRRVGGERDRAQGQIRKHGRADGEGSREQDFRHRRGRHHHRDRARAIDREGRHEVRCRRHEPDGSQARHRQGRGSGRGRAEEALEAHDNQQGDRTGRLDLGQFRHNHRRENCRSHGKSRQGRRDHRRGRQIAGNGARNRRGHAVRPRLPVAVLHQ